MLKIHLYLFLAFLILGSTNTIASAETISYSCSFRIFASPEGLKTEEKPFEFKYIIDRTAKKAYVAGNNGSAQVTEIPNLGGVSFLEVTGSGNIMVTAITSDGDAVHSRHSMDAKKIIPTQYYGKCKKQ